MEEKVIQAALAGLLHDVGKFAQRAGVGLTEIWDKEAERVYYYKHALVSYGFIKKFVPSQWLEGLSGVAYHHRPQSQRDYWVQLADWLSSSERETDEDNRIPRMQSVFSNLNGFNHPSFLPLKKLNPTDQSSLFPGQVTDTGWKEENQRDYERLWQQFEQECQVYQLMQLDDPQVYLENMMALLQDFTWCVPAAFWQNVPDVSLFDHSRTTAAIAACLASDQRPVNWCKEAKTHGKPICYLVGADLSGLQSFIYTLASSGAAKSLRARSFYVQMISDAIAHYVLDRLELPITNLLYVGGGGFQLLTPCGSGQVLNTLAQEISDRLLALHGGALGLTLCWTELFYNDFEHFDNAYKRLGKNINQEKRRPFAAASPAELFKTIGQPITQGGDPIKFCHITGEDGVTVYKDEDGNYKSAFVLSLEKLGRLLPNASYILLTKTTPSAPSLATNWQTALSTFGINVQVVTEASQPNLVEPTIKMVRVWRLAPFADINETKLLDGIPQSSRVVSFRPYAKLTPTDQNGYPKTFDELAIPRRGNFQRWGVLRLDVDNLGMLFQEGFGEKASMSRIASLSFALRLFFEGWLPQLAKPQPHDPVGKDDLGEHLYLQYSGGDDIFVVGAWDVLPEFARRIRRSFGQFACENPHITLSGGMTMADKGFPLYQAAKQAGEAESAAKAFEWGDGKKKDAFTFLDSTNDWKTFAIIQAQAETLAHGIETHRLPHSLLQTMLSLYAQVQQARRKGKKLIYGRWTWMAAYQLTRMATHAKGEENELILKLRDKFLSPDTQTDALGLAARWAQYLTRGG